MNGIIHMKNRKFITAIGFFCLALISTLNGGNMPIYSKQEKIADDIVAQVARSLSARFNLHPVGFGGSVHDAVEKVSLSFNCNRQMSQDEYRKLVVKSANYLLEKINNNNQLEPYLRNYPFDSNNIELSIFIFAEDGSRVQLGEISCVTVINGKVAYSIRETEFTTIWILEESFEDAKRIVAEQGM